MSDWPRWGAAALGLVAVAGATITTVSLLGVRGSGAPTTAPFEPDWTDLAAYERRCQQLNLRGASARVVYQPNAKMTRGDSETLTAAVTLNQSVPPARILHRPGAAEEPGVVVSCRVQAKLDYSHYQFEVSPTRWVERSLLTTDTARWSWFVKAKIGGSHTLVLNLRPIVMLRREAGSPAAIALSSPSNVQLYETAVDVSVPWTERPQETMTRLAATFEVAESLVKTLTGLVLALIALGAVLGIRRRHGRKKRAQPTA